MFHRMNAYDRALQNIKNQLLSLSELVGKQLHQAVHSFMKQDVDLAVQIIQADDQIDFLDDQLEMEALELISIQQPVVDDLRFLVAAMRISRELERISDYACDIAEATIRLKKRGEWFKPLIDLPRMAQMVQTMMQKSLSSYKDKNIDAAKQMDDDDQAVDQLYVELYEELTELIKSQPEAVDQGFSILLIVRYLERIADHVVNISEMVIFNETGERHPFKRKVDSKQ